MKDKKDREGGGGLGPMPEGNKSSKKRNTTLIVAIIVAVAAITATIIFG